MYENNYNLKKINFAKNIIILIKKEGIWYFLKKVFYIYFFPIYILFFIKQRKIIFNNKEIQYFFHNYNYTFMNERAIEIPLVLSLIENIPKIELLEIGNVLSHYVQNEWDVVDKYENSKKVINEDIVNFKPLKKYSCIVAISTFEHIGFDEALKDNKKILNMISNLKKNCLKKNGQIIFTIPVGWNFNLDQLIKTNKIKFSEVYYFKRISWDNKWVISKKEAVFKTTFSKPYIGANGLVLGIIKK